MLKNHSDVHIGNAKWNKPMIYDDDNDEDDDDEGVKQTNDWWLMMMMGWQKDGQVTNWGLTNQLNRPLLCATTNNASAYDGVVDIYIFDNLSFWKVSRLWMKMISKLEFNEDGKKCECTQRER